MAKPGSRCSWEAEKHYDNVMLKLRLRIKQVTQPEGLPLKGIDISEDRGLYTQIIQVSLPWSCILYMIENK